MAVIHGQGFSLSNVCQKNYKKNTMLWKWIKILIAHHLVALFQLIQLVCKTTINLNWKLRLLLIQLKNRPKKFAKQMIDGTLSTWILFLMSLIVQKYPAVITLFNY